MSKLSTVPVLQCTHCGKRIKLSYLGTTQPDSDGTLLWDIFHAIAETALCDYCRQQYNYLAKEGRTREWTQDRYLNTPNRQ